MASDFRWKCLALLLCAQLLVVIANDGANKPKKKKDIRDYNDADMARLLEEWEVMDGDGFGCSPPEIHLGASRELTT